MVQNYDYVVGRIIAGKATAETYDREKINQSLKEEKKEEKEELLAPRIQ